MAYFYPLRKPLRINVPLDNFSSECYTILDVTAGLRNIWRGKSALNVLFLDKNPKVKPDIVADNELLPFRSGVFSEVYYDPPS